jgi:flagellar L-ring protein precursor FlgH
MRRRTEQGGGAMRSGRNHPACWRAVAGLGLVWLFAAGAWAQSSSLLGNPDERQPLSLSQQSWMYQPVEQAREVRMHDLITVIVDEKSEMLSEGEVERRRKTDGTWVLKDWIVLLNGAFGVRPDPQTYGDPTIAHKADGKYRAEGGVETLEAMKFRLTSRVVDVRPNGNLVIEGRRVIQNNDESWEVALTGVVRAEDILPNNTVLSESVAELRISKREAGIVRDNYRRGWFLQWRDRYKPF